MTGREAKTAGALEARGNGCLHDKAKAPRLSPRRATSLFEALAGLSGATMLVIDRALPLLSFHPKCILTKIEMNAPLRFDSSIPGHHC